MYATLEPRQVEKPFVRRWLRATLALLLRSPFRFGVLIALLAGLDTLAVKFADGYVIEKVWVDRLGIVTLPLLWVLVSAVARGADDNRETLQSFSHLGRRSVWLGALGIGVGMGTLSWFFHSLFHGFGAIPTHDSGDYLQHQGDFLASIEGGVVLIVGAAGLAYCPLLALVPELSASHASSLAKKADRINGLTTIIFMTALLAISAIYVAAALPAYGMTTASFLVFFGVLNYVAYRDMFEGRADNLPQQAAAPQPALTAAAGRATQWPRKIRHLRLLDVTLSPTEETPMNAIWLKALGLCAGLGLAQAAGAVDVRLVANPEPSIRPCLLGSDCLGVSKIPVKACRVTGKNAKPGTSCAVDGMRFVGKLVV